MTETSAIYKSCIAFFLAALFGLNFSAITLGIEDWPFTPAPMFAHYIGKETPRYTFEFQGTYDDGSQKELSFAHVGAHWSLIRYFFKYVYGSAQSGQVFSMYQDDTPEKFIKRMATFFRAYTKAHNQNIVEHRKALQRIDLYVKMLSPASTATQKRLVGYYDRTADAFFHTQGSS